MKDARHSACQLSGCAARGVAGIIACLLDGARGPGGLRFYCALETGSRIVALLIAFAQAPAPNAGLCPGAIDPNFPPRALRIGGQSFCLPKEYANGQLWHE